MPRLTRPFLTGVADAMAMKELPRLQRHTHAIPVRVAGMDMVLYDIDNDQEKRADWDNAYRSGMKALPFTKEEWDRFWDNI